MVKGITRETGVGMTTGEMYKEDNQKLTSDIIVRMESGGDGGER